MDIEETKVKKVNMLPIIIWFIIGLLLGAGALFAWNKYMTKTPAQVASQVQQAQVKDIIAKVSKLIMLPTGEDPVVATINDAASLIKDQVFYKGAQNGDIVLVYQKAAKAIVYSPTRNVIVNAGPIFLQDQQQQTIGQTATTTSNTKK
jgi:predicted negative regulator of RcsB-dependent stress response